MRLSRADVVPLLTIIVGGAIGLLLTVSPLLLRSASVNVPAPKPVVARSAPAEQTIRAEVTRTGVVTGRPALSPDGRWLAFVSDETGYSEVYVTSFPDMTSGRWRVSTDGGVKPVWTSSGRLLYVDRDGGRVVAQLEPEQDLQVWVSETSAAVPPASVIVDKPENQ